MHKRAFRMAPMLASLAVAAAFFANSPAAAQIAAPPNARIDVVGLRTGMTEREARDALKAAGFPDRDTAPASPYSPGARATQSRTLELGGFPQTRFLDRIESLRTTPAGDAHETVTLLMPPHGNDSRVWAVTRTERFPRNAAPSFAAIKSALTAKYGDAVQVRGNGVMDWWWDSSGRPLAPRPRPACEGALHNAYIGMDGWHALVRKAPAFPGIAQDDCAYGVRAAILQDQSGVSLRVEIAAMRAGNEASVVTARALQALASAANQKARAEADARKPRL